MKLIRLGGGIGAGKSSVSLRLAARGAVVVDADVIAREVVEPGGPASGPIRTRFGDGVFRDDGTLDRSALAAIVFSSADALADLNAITHPAITEVIKGRVAGLVGRDAIVVLDAALEFDTGVPTAGRIVVDVDPDVAVARLVAYRNYGEEDARARVRSQESRADRIARADFVIDNSGTPDDLDAEVDRAWAWIGSLPEPARLRS